jgi:hypothetical protein
VSSGGVEIIKTTWRSELSPACSRCTRENLYVHPGRPGKRWAQPCTCNPILAFFSTCTTTLPPSSIWHWHVSLPLTIFTYRSRSLYNTLHYIRVRISPLPCHFNDPCPCSILPFDEAIPATTVCYANLGQP